VNNTGFRLFGTYRLEQRTEIRSDCFSDIAKQAELQNQIIATISQSATSSNVALLGAFGKSTSEATANLSNIIKNNVTMSNIQRSYNAIKQRQTASFSNSGVIGFETVELTQGSKLFAAATLQEVDKAGVFNQVASFVDQKSTAKMENPLDFIAKAIGAIGNSVMMSILFFVFILAVVILGIGGLLKLLGGSAPVRSAAPGVIALAAKAPLPPPMKAAALATSMVVK
jgi:hypothetical protein